MMMTMVKTVLPLAGLCDVEGMVGELDNYLALAQGSKFPRDEVDVYTEKILWWWESHETELPCLAKAAMIMFTFTVNSVGCERVFSQTQEHVWAAAGARELSQTTSKRPSCSETTSDWSTN